VLCLGSSRLRSATVAAVGRAGASLAHELRNPPAPLSGAVELLAADLPKTDRHSVTLSQIVQRETARLNRLVSDFLTYARPGPGRSEPVSLRALLEELAELVARDASLGVAVKVSVPDGLSARGTADRLRRVFWTRGRTAAESGPSARAVHVSARAARADELEVLVEARGCGIAPDAMERLFEPFHTTKPKGTGLGLATVHRV